MASCQLQICQEHESVLPRTAPQALCGIASHCPAGITWYCLALSRRQRMWCTLVSSWHCVCYIISCRQTPFGRVSPRIACELQLTSHSCISQWQLLPLAACVLHPAVARSAPARLRATEPHIQCKSGRVIDIWTGHVIKPRCIYVWTMQMDGSHNVNPGVDMFGPMHACKLPHD